MLSISSVAVHAEEADPVNNQKTSTPTIISQSAKIPLPSDNPNIKKYQIKTVYNNGFYAIDVMIDEKLPSHLSLMAASNGYQNRIRLETDKTLYTLSNVKVAYVRAVGLFEYNVRRNVRVNNTYGSGLFDINNSMVNYHTSSVGFSNNTNTATVYTQYRVVTLHGFGEEANKISITCDYMGNRV